MTSRSRSLTRAALALVFAFTAAAQAQGPAADYPSRPIRVVIPSAAGTGPDVNAREIAGELAKALSQSVVVENRPGASGIIGTQLAAKAAPDGYTLFVGTNNSMAIVPSLYDNLPFDVAKDFVPVSLFGILNVGLIANPNLGINDVGGLLAALKAKPDAFNVATLGPGSFYHLSGEWFSQVAGPKLNFVAYSNTSPYADLMAGQVQLLFDALPVAAGHARAGKLKLLAITGKERHPSFPQVPTFTEAGLPSFVPIVWTGLFAPAGTPAAIIDKLNAAMRKGVQDATLKERWALTGGELRAMSPAEFGEFVTASRAMWGRVARQAGVKLTQ